MSVAEEKAALRVQYRQVRRGLAPGVRAAETAATVAACLELIARLPPGPLASYLASGAELDLDGLHRQLWEAGTPVLVPRVGASALLTWHRLRAGQGTTPGAHGIRTVDPGHSPGEPLPGSAVLLLPGVAFAADGRRLGQGGGSYDRVLALHAGVCIGVGFSCQRCDDLPEESHDRKAGGVILGGVLLRDPLRAVEP